MIRFVVTRPEITFAGWERVEFHVSSQYMDGIDLMVIGPSLNMPQNIHTLAYQLFTMFTQLYNTPLDQIEFILFDRVVEFNEFFDWLDTQTDAYANNISLDLVDNKVNVSGIEREVDLTWEVTDTTMIRILTMLTTVKLLNNVSEILFYVDGSMVNFDTFKAVFNKRKGKK